MKTECHGEYLYLVERKKTGVWCNKAPYNLLLSVLWSGQMRECKVHNVWAHTEILYVYHIGNRQR